MSNLPKATPINQERRSIIISYEVPDAWECWEIVLEPGCPARPTAEWLQANPEMWNWDDMRGRGGDAMANLQIEDYNY